MRSQYLTLYSTNPPNPVWLGLKAVAAFFVAILLCTCLEMFRPGSDAAHVLHRSWTILESAESTPEELARAAVDYRNALRALLPGVKKYSQDLAIGSAGEELSGYDRSDLFSEINPVRQSRETTPGLHRPGLGLPGIGSIVPGGSNAPLVGYRVPLTVLAFPQESSPTSFEVRLADPSHSIIGEADGVAPVDSAHLDSTLSEILVPAGHGRFAHSFAIEEMKRILMPESADGKPLPAPDPLRPGAIKEGSPPRDRS